jgi:hypothetical protein
MKRCGIRRQALLQLLLHVIGETKTSGGIGNGASQGGHEDCAKESRMPAHQNFLVAVTLEVGPCSVWQLREIAMLDGKAMKLAILAEGIEKLGPSARVVPEDHLRALFG